MENGSQFNPMFLTRAQQNFNHRLGEFLCQLYNDRGILKNFPVELWVIIGLFVYGKNVKQYTRLSAVYPLRITYHLTNDKKTGMVYYKIKKEQAPYPPWCTDDGETVVVDKSFCVNQPIGYWTAHELVNDRYIRRHEGFLNGAYARAEKKAITSKSQDYPNEYAIADACLDYCTVQTCTHGRFDLCALIRKKHCL